MVCVEGLEVLCTSIKTLVEIVRKDMLDHGVHMHSSVTFNKVKRKSKAHKGNPRQSRSGHEDMGGATLITWGQLTHPTEI